MVYNGGENIQKGSGRGLAANDSETTWQNSRSGKTKEVWLRGRSSFNSLSEMSKYNLENRQARPGKHCRPRQATFLFFVTKLVFKTSTLNPLSGCCLWSQPDGACSSFPCVGRAHCVLLPPALARLSAWARRG